MARSLDSSITGSGSFATKCSVELPPKSLLRGGALAEQPAENRGSNAGDVVSDLAVVIAVQYSTEIADGR